MKLRRTFIGALMTEFVPQGFFCLDHLNPVVHHAQVDGARHLPTTVLSALSSTDAHGEIISAAEALVDTTDDVYHFWYSLVAWLCQTQTVEPDKLMHFVSSLQDWFGVDATATLDAAQAQTTQQHGTCNSGDAAADAALATTTADASNAAPMVIVLF